MFCDKCGAELPDSADFCTECGAKLAKSPNFVDETDMFDMSDSSLEKVPKESRKRSSVVVGIAAVIVFLVLVVAVVMKIINRDGAASKLVHGIQRTVLSSGAEFEIRLKADGESQKAKGSYGIDGKEGLMVYSLDMNDTDYVIAIEDGDFYLYVANDNYDEPLAANKGDLDDFDSELFFDLVSDLGKKDLEKVNWEKYLEEFDLDREIDDYIEPKDIGPAINDVLKALDKNAEDCLGMSRDGDTYSFDIDLHDTVEVILDAVEKYAADEDDFDDLRDEFEDYSEEAEDELGNIEFEVVFDGKYISSISFEADEVKAEISFENIGKYEGSLDSKVKKACKESD